MGDDARRHVVGRDPVLGQHPPDLGHRQRRRPARIRSADDRRQQPVLGDVIEVILASALVNFDTYTADTFTFYGAVWGPQ